MPQMTKIGGEVNEELLSKLVGHVISESNGNFDHSFPRLVRYCLRILHSNMTSANINESQLLESVLSKISLNITDKEKNRNLLKTFLALSSKNGLQILEFLSKVADQRKNQKNSVHLNSNAVYRKISSTPVITANSRIVIDTPAKLFSHDIGKLYEIPESELIREAIFALQGIDGELVKFDQVRHKAIIARHIPLPAVEVLTRLSKFGAAYQRIRMFIQSYKGTPGNNIVFQCFCHSVQEVLNDYHQQVLAIEKGIVKTLVDKEKLIQDGTSLKRLMVQTEQIGKTVSSLDKCVSECLEKKSHEILNHLYQLKDDCSLFIQTAFSSAFSAYAKLILGWITEGLILDPYCEFFITSDNTQKSWNCSILQVDYIPQFISIELANKILNAGKVLLLMSADLDHAQLAPAKSRIMSVLSSLGSSLNVSFPFKLHQAICEYAFNIDRQFVYILMNKYHLQQHMAACHKYLLLCQGDFFQNLLDLASESMNRPASMLFRHNLSSLVETAAKSSVLEMSSANIIDCLDVRLLQIADGDVGWDVFCLDYRITFPLDIILTPNIMKDYAQAFLFIWNIRKLEWILQENWLNLRQSKKLDNPSLWQLRVILYRCLSLLKYLISTLIYGPISNAWSMVMTSILETGDIHVIQSLFEKYLSDSLKNIRILQQERSGFVLLTSIVSSLQALASASASTPLSHFTSEAIHAIDLKLQKFIFQLGLFFPDEIIL